MQARHISPTSKLFPPSLGVIASPPKSLYLAGAELSRFSKRTHVAIVGSRKASRYGQEVTVQLARQLAESGVVIISGLALGVDSLAHKAALDVGGSTIAVLPRGLDKIYPASHQQLAEQIVKNGGTLITEYPEGTELFKPNFIARNRLIAGLADAVVITEAAEKSGSLHTARFALEQGKEVLAVPGNITSPLSIGSNNLLKAGAAPVLSYIDVLHALGLEPQLATKLKPKASNAQETLVLDLVSGGVQDGDELLIKSQLDMASFNQTLTMLEINGQLRALGANQWTLAA